MSKHECGEVDFLGQLNETFQCSSPGIEGSRPGFYLGDVLETACQCLQ